MLSEGEIYLSNAVYDRLIAALMAAPRVCEFTGQPDSDAIKIALGEVADIWPVDIAAAAQIATA